MKKTPGLQKQKVKKPSRAKSDLLGDLRQMIELTRQSVANAINVGLTALNWKIGYRIRSEILKNKRAEYGKEIIATVSKELSQEYGVGFSEKNIRRMIQFAEVFPDEKIVVSLIRQLSWTHFIALIPIKDPLKRDFYAEMCRIEK